MAQATRIPASAPVSARFSALTLAATAALALTLTACGGGGGGSTASTTESTSGAASYSGAVSGLGSIVVNGVRFSTSGATVADPDDSSQRYLRAFALGTTVSVQGVVDDNSTQASASSITVHGGVRGQVTAVNTGVTPNTLTVAGQSIAVNANTVYEGLNSAALTLSGLQSAVAGGTVYAEVYVTGDAASGFVATRVELKTSSEVLISGHAVVGKVVVGSLDAVNGRFDLLLRNGVTLTINYPNGALRPVGATLSEGALVRVLSPNSTSSLVDGDTLNVTKVIVKGERLAAGRAKLRGVVAAINGSLWTLGDVTVDVSQVREVEGFASLAAVQPGAVVKVKGSFVNGVLVAREVESEDAERARDGGGVKLYGVVTASDSGARTFSVQGVSVAVPVGVTVPAVGAYIEVLAQLSNGTLTLVRSSTGDDRIGRDFEVHGTASCTQGSADLMATFNLTLRNGTATSVNGRNAVIELEDNVDMTVSNSGARTCVVEVKGTPTSGGITATKIEVKSRTASVG